MGRKKKDLGIGRSIIRDRFQGKRGASSGDSFLHTSELQDGYDWGRLNLQSVTEQSNLDEFLATAELAGTEFAAEKLNVQIVSSDHRHSGLPSAEELKKSHAAQEENRALLTIPRRPPWDEHTTREELELRERTSFLEWRRKLAELQENEDLVMTPFERNLDFWRQLWRVIERSDIVVQIVDARNPLLFRCGDLEKYVKEVSEHKVNMLLINKADLLSEGQRKHWAEYFDNIGVIVAFWSAVMEKERCDKLQVEGNELEGEIEDNTDDDTSSEDGIPDDCTREKHETESLNEHRNTSESENTKDEGTEKEELLRQEHKPRETLTSKEPDEEGNQSNLTGQQSTEGMTQQFQNVMSREFQRDCGNACAAEACRDCGNACPPESCRDSGDRLQEASSNEAGSFLPTCSGKTKNNAALLTGEELIDLLKSTHAGPKVTEGVITIGLVGYPNVGKSSSINAILQSKKVPVSATPGRTKHFQTLYVDPTVLLCDCPGLVMPTFVTTKADMIVSGILPIDQMRDHIPPTSLVCQYIPREVLEVTYGIMLPRPSEGENPDRHPTAHELLASYGYMRGFMTHKGIPDFPRSARNILKDFMNGRLLYAHPPPGIEADVFQSAAPAQKTQKLSRVDHTGYQRKTPSLYNSSVDRQFFEKVSVGMGVKGVAGRMAASEAEKSNKKHFKKGKKEKLRRLHGHLDV